MRPFFLILLVCTLVQALPSPILDKKVFTRYLEAPNNIRDVRCFLSQGDTWVPVIGLQKSRSLFVSKRRALFAAGVYPGVEYKLMNITVLNTSAATIPSARTEVMTLQGLLEREIKNSAMTTGVVTTSSTATPPSAPVGQFFDQVLNSVVSNSNDNTINNNNSNNKNDLFVISEEAESIVELTVAPAYPLIKGLEREWPVRIALSEIPYVVTKGMYNTVTLMGTLSFALSLLTAVFVATQLFTFSFVNSRSMTPTILPGDLILVEKITPVLRRDVLHVAPAVPGDIVFFSAPPALLRYIEEQKEVEEKARVSVSNGNSNNKNNRVTSRTDAIAAPSSSSVIEEATTASSSSSSSSSSTSSAGSPFNSRFRPIAGNALLVKRVKNIQPLTPSSQLQKQERISSSSSGSSSSSSSSGSSSSSSNGDIGSSSSTGSSTILAVVSKDTPTCLVVLGDNPEVSLDSRQWGCLDPSYVMGRPVLRVLPPSRFGPLL